MCYMISPTPNLIESQYFWGEKKIYFLMIWVGFATGSGSIKSKVYGSGSLRTWTSSIFDIKVQPCIPGCVWRRPGRGQGERVLPASWLPSWFSEKSNCWTRMSSTPSSQGTPKGMQWRRSTLLPVLFFIHNLVTFLFFINNLATCLILYL